MNTQTTSIKSKSLRPRIIITHKELVYKAKPLTSKVINNDFDRTTSTILNNRMVTNINSKVDKVINMFGAKVFI